MIVKGKYRNTVLPLTGHCRSAADEDNGGEPMMPRKVAGHPFFLVSGRSGQKINDRLRGEQEISPTQPPTFVLWIRGFRQQIAANLLISWWARQGSNL